VRRGPFKPFKAFSGKEPTGSEKDDFNDLNFVNGLNVFN